MKTYHEIRAKHLADLGKSSSGGFFLFGAVLFFAAFVIILSLLNTASMQSVSTSNAKEYVSELTLKTASTVSTDVSDKKTNLSSIAESLHFHFDDDIDATNTDDYIKKHLQTLYEQTKFDFLIFVHADAEVLQFGELPGTLGATLESAEGAIQEAEEADECIAYVADTSILYAVPVYSENQIVGSLIAGSSIASLTELMQSHIFQAQTSFCITNREGDLLVASGNSRFTELAEKLSLDNPESSAQAAEMLSNFNNGVLGVIEVKLSDGENYLMTYVPVEGEDWMIVTLIPTNVFSKTYTSYMQRSLAYTIGAAVMFVILLALMVSSYRGARKKLEYIAYTDEFTAGINSLDFQMRYGMLQRHANPLEYSIVMLDINDFKLINELGGFEAGDNLIKYVYDTVGQKLDAKELEFVCRVEVDHYFICMHENTQEGIQARIDQIEAAVNTEGQDKTLGLHISFGIGACIVNDAQTDIAELTQRARIAKRNATPDQRNKCVMYTEEMRHAISQKVQLDYMAEKGIQNREFVVYYQPKVSRSTGKIKGAEALVRWIHPNRGFISPAEFVPALEESGRIQEVDLYVFEEVCRYLAERKERGEALFTVSFNVSRLHFWIDNFVDEYAAIADKYGVDHSLLEFEITETVFMQEDKLDKIKAGIQHIHEQGFTCALDDFGVGYSSLGFVNEMDIDTLKFDRSFFLNLEDEKSRKVVASLINMGNSLELDMIVEGIETQDQIDFLATTQADVVQGYYYARPLSEADFEAWEASRA